MGKIIMGGAEFKFNNLYKNGVETDEIGIMFYNNDQVTYVEMEKITIVNGRAFYNCSKLNTVILKNVRVLGEEAFVGCSFKTIDILNVVSIGEGAFRNCGNLESAILNEEIIEIQDEVFSWCSNLKTIKFSSNLERIGYRAFYRCSKVEISFPTNIREIGREAFYLGGNGEIILPNTVNIGQEAFRRSYFSRVVINKITTITRNLLSGSKMITAEFENVETIEEFGLSECGELTNIYIPKIKKIGDFAFTSCVKLSFASLPETLEEIGAAAFGGTLISIKQLPPKINTIPDQCFAACPLLTDLTLGGKGYPIISIADYAFNNSNNLTKLTIYTTGGQALVGAPWRATNATITYLPA